MIQFIKLEFKAFISPNKLITFIKLKPKVSNSFENKLIWKNIIIFVIKLIIGIKALFISKAIDNLFSY